MNKFLVGMLLTFCLCFAACERKVGAPTGETKRYELKGKVVEVEQEKKRLKVAHEEIKGFMAAMTMWFPVKDDANFSQAAVGDSITATLVYNPADNRSWLENLKVAK
jgi:Cu/Ag efflux protein CusF